VPRLVLFLPASRCLEPLAVAAVLHAAGIYAHAHLLQAQTRRGGTKASMFMFPCCYILLYDGVVTFLPAPVRLQRSLTTLFNTSNLRLMDVRWMVRGMTPVFFAGVADLAAGKRRRYTNVSS